MGKPPSMPSVSLPVARFPIHLSHAIRESYSSIHASSHEIAIRNLEKELEAKLLPVARRLADVSLLGFIGYVRVPYVTPMKSRIIQLDGQPYTWEVRSNSASCYLLIRNKHCELGRLMVSLTRDFSQTDHDIPPQFLPLE